MKMTTTRSPKFRRLMRLSGLNRAAAAGTLELLWLFTMEQSPAGNVGKWSDQDLEDELDWEGEPSKLIDALVEAGWLDRCEKYRLVIHDWSDHLPDFIQKRVDRGTLIIAIPREETADNGGQRRTTADNGGNVPIREGKGREVKPREGKTKRARSAKRASACVCPDELETPDQELIRIWASEQKPPISPELLGPAWLVVRDWARGKDHRRVDWVATFRNSLREGWSIRSPLTSGLSNAQAKAERTNEAAREALRQFDKRAQEPESNLRQIGGSE